MVSIGFYLISHQEFRFVLLLLIQSVCLLKGLQYILTIQNSYGSWEG